VSAPSPGVRLRVHFVPVGYEVDRVVSPLRSLRADAAILFTFSRTDRVSGCLREIQNRLDSVSLQHRVIECNVWDVATIATEVGSMVASAPRHDYFFNVSTGPKTACVAGTIAGMFWPIRLYYVPVDYDSKPRFNEHDFVVRDSPVFIPTFETPPVDKTTISTLTHIMERGPRSKRELIEYLRSSGAIGPRLRASVTPQALHAQADVILRRLDAWGFIEIEGRGRALRVKVTNMGVAAAKMFNHILHPRPPPDILR